jgi:hypothetical protein
VRLDTSLAAVDPGALIHQAPLVRDGGGASTKGSGGAAPKQRHTAVVIFSYLKSWEQMGKAQFRCEGKDASAADFWNPPGRDELLGMNVAQETRE